MIEVEIIKGVAVNKIDKNYHSERYNKYRGQMDKRQYIYAIIGYNKHEVERGDVFEV